MKKLFLPLAIILLLALVACGNAEELANQAGDAATRLAEEGGDAVATAAAVATDVADGPDDGETPEEVDPADEEPEVEATEEPEPEPGPSDRWAGTVIMQDGGDASGVTINISGAETQSDANGNFELSVPRAEDGRYVINAEKEGYLPISQIHIGTAIEDLALEFQPVETFTVDPTQPIDVADSSGTQIKIDENQLVDADGNAPSGDVMLNMYTYDLDEEEMVGDMGGTNTDGEPVFMESEGAFYADFTDEDGTEYNLADDATAEISIPCEPRPDEVLTVWSYDTETGLWVEEAAATVDGYRCSAQVTHFSYWNFDYEKRTPSCIKLDIQPDLLMETTPLQIKAVLQTNPVRVQELSTTDEVSVLYNLPNNTDVQFFMPPDAATPFATTNSGAPWGGIGVPAAPYGACNGTAEIAPAEPTPLILQSVNYPERYLAVNADGTAIELVPVSLDSDDALKQRATFMQVPGLADTNMVSLQTNSGAYIVATPDGVTLQAMPDIDELRRAATFNLVDGLAGTGVSFESLAHPGYYLRHSGFILRLNTSDGSDLFNQDTSYNGVAEFVAAEPTDAPTTTETTNEAGEIELTLASSTVIAGDLAAFEGSGSEYTVATGDYFAYLTTEYRGGDSRFGIKNGDVAPLIIIANSSISFQATILAGAVAESGNAQAAAQALDTPSGFTADSLFRVASIGAVNQSLQEGDFVEVLLGDATSSEPPYVVNIYRGENRELVSTFTINNQ